MLGSGGDGEQGEVQSAAEAAISASAALFRDGPLPMWIFEVPTLRILAVNDAAVREYGYGRDEFLRMTIRELRRPGDMPRDLGRMDRTGEGLVLRGPYRHRRKDGSLLDVDVHVMDVPFEGRFARLAVAHNVSERRRAEERERFLSEITRELAGSLDYDRTLERLTQLAIQHLADGCAVHMRSEGGQAALRAAASRDPEKAVLLREVERRAPARYGALVGPTAVLRTGRVEYYRDVSASASVDGTIGLWRRLGVTSCICVPLLAPGHERPLGALSLASLAPDRLFEQVDVQMAEELARHAALAIENARLYEAERRARRVAERLAERNERLQHITAALARTITAADALDVVIAQGIAALDAQAGSVAVLSEDRRRLDVVVATGYSPEMLARYGSLPVDARLPLTDVVRTGAPIWLRNLAERDARYPQLSSLRSEDGDGAMAAVPLLVESAVIGALGLNFRVGVPVNAEDRAFVETLAAQCAQALERARLYEAERRARAAMEAARLEAEAANRSKTEFLAVMSHELRTPLNAIAGYAELIEMGIRGPVTAEQQEDLRRIRRSQQHLLGLINDVLNFAKLETGTVRYEITDVPVHEVLHAVEPLIAPQLAAKALRCEFPPDDGTLIARADRDKLQQILLNLLSNAVKFTEPGGRITLACEADGGHALIHVQDTGIGIPLDRQEVIFEPFVQLDQRLTRTSEGTGLGLAISRDLARAMGGELTLVSVVGEGARFTVRVPRGRSGG